MNRIPIGIRKTGPSTWGVVLVAPTSAVPGRQAPIIYLGPEFTGPGAKARAIREARTNRIIDGSAAKVAALAHALADVAA